MSVCVGGGGKGGWKRQTEAAREQKVGAQGEPELREDIYNTY